MSTGRIGDGWIGVTGAVLIDLVIGLNDLAVTVGGFATVGVVAIDGLVLFFDETQVFQRLLDC